MAESPRRPIGRLLQRATTLEKQIPALVNEYEEIRAELYERGLVMRGAGLDVLLLAQEVEERLTPRAVDGAR